MSLVPDLFWGRDNFKGSSLVLNIRIESYYFISFDFVPLFAKINSSEGGVFKKSSEFSNIGDAIFWKTTKPILFY